MKRIYTFTLEADEYASKRFRSDLRLLAYLLYDSIYNYDGEDVTALNINKNIVYNGINDNGDYYYMDSDIYDNGYINYEPFIIGKNTFALTIDDSIMDESTIRELLEIELRLSRLSYNIVINSQPYMSKNKDDERLRHRAINILCSKLGCSLVKRFPFVDFFVGDYSKKNAVLVRKY